MSESRCERCHELSGGRALCAGCSLEMCEGCGERKLHGCYGGRWLCRPCVRGDTGHDYGRATRLLLMRDEFCRGASVTKSELAARHGVSTRTIERDLGVLDTALDTPLRRSSEGRYRKVRVGT